MIKALLKKELAQFGTSFLKNSRRGKGRTGKGTLIGLGILLIFLLFSLGMFFFEITGMIAEPLLSTGRTWLYFSIMGLAGIVFGVLFSAFNTYTTIYKAKDNDLLLSMPIPTRTILFVRMLSVYLSSLLYSGIVFIPTIIQFIVSGGEAVTAASIVFSIILFLVNGLLIVTLACLLGWIVALISNKISNKSFVTVLAYIVFIGVYYTFYFRLNAILTSVLSNLDAVEQKISTVIWPLYQFGLGCSGKVSGFLLYILFTAVIFSIVVWIMDRGFVGIATAGKSGPRKKYVETAAKVSGQRTALFKKELARFTSSPNYMMNCGLGLLFMLVGAVFLIVKHGAVSEALGEVFGMDASIKGIMLLAAGAGTAMMAGMNYITAPSVSLEGKNIWIVQSSPVHPRIALQAKELMHMAIVMPPTLFLGITAAVILGASLPEILLLIVFLTAYVAFMDSLGLFLNLKVPRLDWTNETQPIKQSVPVLVSMFGGWVVVALLGALYIFVLMAVVGPMLYMCICTLLFAGAAVLLNLWIQGKGAEKFATL